MTTFKLRSGKPLIRSRPGRQTFIPQFYVPPARESEREYRARLLGLDKPKPRPEVSK